MEAHSDLPIVDEVGVGTAIADRGCRTQAVNHGAICALEGIVAAIFPV